MNLGPTELILILGVALVIFGPGKLPELGQTLGKTIREFKGAINNIDEDIKKDLGDIKTEVQEVKNAVDVRATIDDLKKDVKDAVQVDLTAAETAKEAPVQVTDSAAEQK